MCHSPVRMDLRYDIHVNQDVRLDCRMQWPDKNKLSCLNHRRSVGSLFTTLPCLGTCHCWMCKRDRSQPESKYNPFREETMWPRHMVYDGLDI